PEASDISSPPCLLRLLPAGAISPGGPCTHWKAPPSHGAPLEPSFAVPTSGSAGVGTNPSLFEPCRHRCPESLHSTRTELGQRQMFRAVRQSTPLRWSYWTRAASNSARWPLTHCPNANTGSDIECPSLVRLYSTCGGLVGWIVRVPMPS